MLGCGEWKVIITGRGGSPFRYDLDYESFDFPLPLSAASDFTVNLPLSGTSPSCCEVISETDPYADEVSFYRNGSLVMCGPVIDMELGTDGFRISGKDLFNGWMEKRFVDDDLSFYQDLAEIFRLVVEYAVDKDPSINLSVNSRNIEVKGNRTYDASAYRKCSDILNELTSAQMGYVVRGRDVYVGDLDELLGGDTILLSDEAVATITISKRGRGLVNDLVVLGEIPLRESSQVAGRARRGVDHYGLLQDSVVDLLLHEFEDCSLAALERLRAFYPLPVQIDVTLTAKAEVSFADLLPGKQVRPLFSSDLVCLDAFGTLLLDGVRVSDGSNGETVTLNLVPVGDTTGESIG